MKATECAADETFADIADFLRAGKTPWHVQELLKRDLRAAGFRELCEGEPWELQPDGAYFVARGAALIAFRIGGAKFAVAACHTDTPGFRLKQAPDKEVGGASVALTESYGGGIWHTWTDRRLGVAGRLLVRAENGARAVNVDLPDNFIIPSLAIHLNREVNKGAALNLAKELNLVAGGALLPRAAQAAGAPVEDVLSSELFVYNREEPFLVGERLLCAPRIDDLASAYAILRALCAPSAAAAAMTAVPSTSAATAVAFFATHEEVGSQTLSGAGGTFLADTLARLAEARSFNLRQAVAESFLLSADNAHATHPLYPELMQNTDSALLGRGVVLKRNANSRYTTDAESAAAVRLLCERAGVSCQNFAVRSDLPCGSTLGVVSISQVSVRSADIGVGQLAMHASCEVCDLGDVQSLRRLLAAFYGADLRFLPDGVALRP